MDTKNKLTAIATYFLYVTSGFGCYHLAHVFGWTSLQVDAITISPAQAHEVQTGLEFATETIKPRKTK